MMVANSALHYAAGILAAGCQLRRNWVTKTPKTSILASINLAMPSESSALVSIPHQLQLERNSFSTKRNKTIVAAYPDLKIEVIVVPGVPEYTMLEFQNFTSETLERGQDHFWIGAQNEHPRIYIMSRHIGHFKHRAGPGGSIGGVEYVFPEYKFRWIVAWSNAKDDLNKVYTEILRDDPDWNQIQENLKISSNIYKFNGEEHGIQYSSWVEIDKTSPTPTVRAKIAVNTLATPLSTDLIEIPADSTHGDSSTDESYWAKLPKPRRLDGKDESVRKLDDK